MSCTDCRFFRAPNEAELDRDRRMDPGQISPLLGICQNLLMDSSQALTMYELSECGHFAEIPRSRPRPAQEEQQEVAPTTPEEGPRCDQCRYFLRLMSGTRYYQKHGVTEELPVVGGCNQVNDGSDFFLMTTLFPCGAFDAKPDPSSSASLFGTGKRKIEL